MEVVLRPLARADFGLLGAWLREPLVAEWWHDDPDPEALERQYGAAIDGTDPARLRIGTLDGDPVGFVQWYRLADEPGYATELAALLPVPDDAWSLDYLVGAPEHRRRGFGTALVRAALAAIGPAPVIVPVHAENLASAGVLRRAGFSLAAEGELEPDNAAHSRRHLVLVRASLDDGD
jgi:aminoglycoside 6'-N-acetyltransferase